MTSQSSDFNVCILGGINIDFFSVVKDMPLAGETIVGSDFFVTPGGKGANQAVAASRLGVDVSFIGKIGADVLTTDVYITSTAGGASGTVYVNNLDVSGTLSTAGNTTQSGDLTVQGNLTVQGDTVTMNTATIVSEDKNIELNNGTSATMTDLGAVGGGFTLKGDTNKTFVWSNVNTNSTNDSFDSSEDLNIADTKFFTINKKRALTQTQCYINTKAGLAAADFDDSAPALYLNQATPMTNAANEWRVKIDGAGDVVFQKRTASANGWQNKFRIQ